MQQFKRTEPKRLRRASEESSLKTSSEESGPKRVQEKAVVGNGDAPSLAATSDAAVALALQQELGREAASAREEGLEEKGLFFCQICQKNLSAMNVIRREQHVNRCLDEAEKVLRPASPQVPDCPICGKPLLTPKSRLSHLKQCAVKMEVSPQLLLQAVRLQAAQSEADGDPQTPSAHTGSLKRKGASSKKEPQKRHKVHKPEPLSEDLLVAMALSRSEMEQCPAMPTLRLESAFSERIKPGAEKKSRKKKPLMSPPQLLVQDSKITGRQIEDRVAQLLSEEMELSSTPPLPTSKIFKEELEEAGWRLQLPKGKRNFLWKGSTLTGAWTEESFYTVGLLPPIVSHRPAKELETLVLPKQSDPDGHRPPVLHGRALPVGQSPRKPLLSASQRERQALQDLVDLAEEGLTASPWPGSSGEPTELDLIPSSLPLTGFVVPSKEKLLKRGDHSKLSLQLLVTDFGAMVNNPHLSDVQFQTDSGEVLYAHKFVLYARCPRLMQYVTKEGFSATEDGDLTQRVLLSDVSSEAAHAFLNYLYVADTDLSPSLAPDLCSLALRFGVSDLVHLCEQVPAMLDLEERQQEEKEDENCESRAENFQELLRSMWADEEEEAETLLKSEVLEEDRENMNEAEMEEIYEFAATQRKLLQEEQAAEREKEPEQCGEASPTAAPLRAGVRDNKQLENTEQRVSEGLPGSWENPRHSRQPLQKQCSEGSGGAETQDQETPREAASPCSSSSSPGGHQSESEESSLSCPATALGYRQQFESTQEFAELSQITVDEKEQSEPVREWGVETTHPTTPQKAPPSEPPGDGSPSQSWLHLYHTSDLSRSHGGIFKVTSPSSPSPATPAKPRRGSGTVTPLKEPDHQKGRRGSSVLQCKNRGVLISPAKSPPIDLTQSVPDHLSPRSEDPPNLAKKDDEVILLLDSDEELELEQNRTKSVSNDLPEESRVLEGSPKSSELFSVIDVEEDQEHFPSPLKTEAKLRQEEEEGQLENRASLGRKRTSWLLCHQLSSPDEDSPTDSSWLVPATPPAGRSRDGSSQTQITGLRSRTPADETAEHLPSTSEPRIVPEAPQKFSVIMPHTGPATLETSDRGRQAFGSPARAHPRHHKLASPLALGPVRSFPRQLHKLSPTGLFQTNQAAADEVVEVGDSDDEQDAASPPGSSSQLLDSDPPVPAGDDCWPVEPLSPIPIDSLNLERTGPLHTSSPSSQAQQALDGNRCSPDLLGATPVRGSHAARRETREQASRASSPGNSRLSFLNPALWGDWDEEEQASPEAPQIPSPRAPKQGLEMPSANQKKNVPPKVPITPMPRYSIMETPVLKKELDRFGVRPLPKRQMVLKLKEIFQYTHQSLESDSEDELQSSHVPLEALCTETCKPSRSPAREPPPGPDGDAQLPASQDSVTTSVDGSDSSFSSQSSSCEFGAALESDGEAECEEDGISASQAATRAADTEEAVRRYICSKPELYRKVLMYQPLELAELQAQLKQDGVHVATGKLLDILDAQCITFTTAATRKEKLKQKRQPRLGRKKRE